METLCHFKEDNHQFLTLFPFTDHAGGASITSKTPSSLLDISRFIVTLVARVKKQQKDCFYFPLCASGVFAPQLSQVQELRKASWAARMPSWCIHAEDTVDYFTFKSKLSKHACLSPPLQKCNKASVSPQELIVYW